MGYQHGLIGWVGGGTWLQTTRMESKLETHSFGPYWKTWARLADRESLKKKSNLTEMLLTPKVL